jgi:hypothetical protein
MSFTFRDGYGSGCPASHAMYQGTTLQTAEKALYEGHGFSRAALDED